MRVLLDQVYKIWNGNSEEMINIRASEIETLTHGSDKEKACCIDSLFGIFEGTVKNNIYTYYFWSSDVSIGGIYNYSGKRREREWRKLAQCYKVDFNIRTDEVKITPTRWNKRCVENAERMI